MFRNRPLNLSHTFEWPPSPDDLLAVSVMQVASPAATPALRAASPYPATSSAATALPVRRQRRRLDTLQQLTLLAAGMLVGAALPGIDDGRRPAIGIAHAAEAATVTPAPAAAETKRAAPVAREALATAPAALSRPDAVHHLATSAAASPAASTSSTRSASVAPVPHDPRTQQVLQVLRRYESAFSRMDAGATSAVWPSANRDELTRSFTAVREQRLRLHRCSVSGAGAEAAGTCRGTLRYRPRVGDHSTKLRRGTWRFALERADEGWVIRRVNVS